LGWVLALSKMCLRWGRCERHPYPNLNSSPNPKTLTLILTLTLTLTLTPTLTNPNPNPYRDPNLTLTLFLSLFLFLFLFLFLTLTQTPNLHLNLTLALTISLTQVGSVGTFSWGGAASTYFFIDPVEDLVVVYATQLMNRDDHVFPRNGMLVAMVYGALEDTAQKQRLPPFSKL
jgi:CubicO group peptidase (beta-lactamase class C family)